MGRTYVVIADKVLSAIDRIAGKRGRSRFIEDAAREKLARMELEEALRETAGVAKGKRYGHWADRAAATAWVRQIRRSGMHQLGRQAVEREASDRDH